MTTSRLTVLDVYSNIKTTERRWTKWEEEPLTNVESTAWKAFRHEEFGAGQESSALGSFSFDKERVGRPGGVLGGATALRSKARR